MDPEMDAECIPLCEALNLWPGIETCMSCCGHGTGRFYVYFRADSEESLAEVAHLVNTGPGLRRSPGNGARD
jgi:hypothetical protein